MAVEGFTVDLKKPLVFQVGHLGEAYQEWADHPIPSKEGHRLFANDFLESISRANCWAMPLGWIPVACWFISKAGKMMVSLPEAALMVVLGIFLWTAVEYGLHRFFFHMDTNTYWGNTIHFILNGYHHKNPMDRARIVSPPYFAAAMCYPVYHLVRLFSTPAAAPAVFGGWLLGYVMYEMTHYYLHHGHPTNSLLKNLKKHHMNHHFGVSQMGFGITTLFWDMVFGTVAEKVGHY